MPSYRDVAQLRLAALIDPGDKPRIALEADPIRVIAEKLAEQEGGAVVVVDDAQRVVGVISANDLAQAITQGMNVDTPAKELIARKPPVVTVPDTSLLEELPTRVGPYSTLIVTDQDGKPEAVLDRAALAERVRNRFATA